ncbi:MAG: hypothetical protein A2072_08220 [Nitrospirae bacterium GWC1_57_7]|nr:MAG: hypothetical protein A2072_08220 [Nitrospirae bacterium GWC1_57_7]HAR45838.1 glycogen synthase GlgA [Nitrospiraceae bacterium]
MKALFAASEAAPFAKTGGLADVAGTLPPALAALGHDVRLVLPLYQAVDRERFGLQHAATFTVPLGSWKERCDVLTGSLPGGVTTYFVRKDVYFDRPGLYGTTRGDFRDNAERFIFFSRAVLELCRALDFRPDIIHCNDWQTALVPFYVKKLYGESELFRRTRTVFTIHNLGYQGVFLQEDMRYTSLGMDSFTPQTLEYWGKMNLMKGALLTADAITTVSRSYSREIQTPEYGYGLEGVLMDRAADLYGIVNGIDYGTWDPAHDQAIAQQFDADAPAGKIACRSALRKITGLPESEAPLAGMVARLAAQKGLDILTEALPGLLEQGLQVVILGTGDDKYLKLLALVEKQYPDRMRLISRFDDPAARAVYAGSDLFLMPSLYEPCGLGQMIALRYGSVPVVRNTGGLADTVIDHPGGMGTGFLFEEYSAEALTECVQRAQRAFQDKKEWAALMRNGMKQDFSLERMAGEYVAVYEKLLGAH